MGSMMADLKGVHSGINMYHKQQGNPELSIDDLLVKLFNEVEYVWPVFWLPTISNALQPICQEYCTDECV